MNALERNGLQGTDGNGQTFVQFVSRWQFAVEEGLDAAGDIFRDALTHKLMRGYTSGKFVTGKAAESVKLKPARVTRQGETETRVFTKDFRAGLWEFGAYNAFTRKFERVEYWRMTLEEQGTAMTQAFHKAFTNALGA